MKISRAVPGALAALSLTVFSLAGCGDDSFSPTQAGEDAAAADDFYAGDEADLGRAEFAPSGTDNSVGVPWGTRSYEIVLENLTPATGAGSSQPFSPPVIAVHDRSVRLWRKGRTASDEIAGLAEDAMNGPLVDWLNASSHVFDVEVGGGVILPGESDRWMISAAAGARRLSMAFMLVNTNDGFSGTSSVRMPRDGEVVHYLYAMDAGSEENTELAAHIPGPCCGSPGEGPDEHERIRRHDGILGVGDLDPATWGWEGAVAKLTIRALQPRYEVRLANLTPDLGNGASQVFSPPVLASHRPSVRMFRVGKFASDELAALAEDGMTGPLVGALEGSDAVADIVTGDGPIFPGADSTFEIETGRWVRRLSLATMLVNTNDAFTGVDALRLPGGGRAIWYLDAYDAGSEENTELEMHIPGPCCGSPGAGIDTHERIRPHAGILGIGDLAQETWGWTGPVAMLEITRIQ